VVAEKREAGDYRWWRGCSAAVPARLAYPHGAALVGTQSLSLGPLKAGPVGFGTLPVYQWTARQFIAHSLTRASPR
jgi:hypothetical protein